MKHAYTYNLSSFCILSQHLSRRKVWLLDGTFKCCPRVYGSRGQVYTIHGYYNKKDSSGRTRSLTVPLVYAVLPDKKESTYTKLFSLIKSISPFVLLPKLCIVDFEKAVINSLSNVFVGTRVRACWFHFNQNLFRKVQDLGLQKAYYANVKFRNNVKLLVSLAFVPAKDVRTRFIQLLSAFPQDFYLLAKYFYNTYIGDEKHPALFQISLWNLNRRVVDEIPRTTNAVEGWHHHMNLYMQSSKPPLWKFIHVIRNEQTRSENLLGKLNDISTLRLQKKEIRERNAKLEDLCKQYMEDTTTVKRYRKWLSQFLPLIPSMDL